MEMPNVSSDKLMQDLRAVVTDIEELLKATAGEASDEVAKARIRAEATLSNAKTRLMEAEREIAGRARGAVRRGRSVCSRGPLADHRRRGRRRTRAHLAVGSALSAIAT